MRGNRQTGSLARVLLIGNVGIVFFACSHARAQYLPVYGGPIYDDNTGTGFNGPLVIGGAGRGAAVGSAYKWLTSGGSNAGNRPFRLNSGTSMTVVEMGNLGLSNSGTTFAYPSAINDAGTSVGYAWKYVAGSSKGAWPVRWDATGAATELGNLGTDASGNTTTTATDVYAINNYGTAVGFATKYVSDSGKGTRAVRWDASGTAATELDSLGLSSTSTTNSQALAINDVGVAVGYSNRYDATVAKGQRPVRWNASGTGVTELDNLGTDANGNSNFAGMGARANAINSTGTAVGTAVKFEGGVGKGLRAVRWDAASTAATELGNLGTTATGNINGLDVLNINDSGTAVGWAFKYDAAGTNLGGRPVRWDGSTTVATELGLLGTPPDGTTAIQAMPAYDINNAGIAVGAVPDYRNGPPYLTRAVIWGLDGIAIDLNSMVNPASGWTLDTAYSISDDNWVSGTGQFDPDGIGPQAAYSRMFLMQVPEPTSVSLLALSLLALRIRRRSNVAVELQM